MCSGISRFLKPFMKPGTRDNLIYLAVGLSIAALLVADFFYADIHGREMWMPSRFALRLLYTTALLVYFVVKESLKAKAKVGQVLACVLFASGVHLAIGFGFRQALGNLSGMSFSFWVVVELFLLVQLLKHVIQYFEFV
jgi:hypothetical protein